MHLKEKAKQLKTDIPAIFLSLKDSRTPFTAKIFGGLTIAYALSPIDLVPDFVPVFGYLDDVIILPLLVVVTLKFLPKEIFEEYKEKSKDLWNNGKPKKWYYALPIILFWILIVYVLYKMIMK